MHSLSLKKQTSKNVADTTFKERISKANKGVGRELSVFFYVLVCTMNIILLQKRIL